MEIKEANCIWYIIQYNYCCLKKGLQMHPLLIQKSIWNLELTINFIALKFLQAMVKRVMEPTDRTNPKNIWLCFSFNHMQGDFTFTFFHFSLSKFLGFPVLILWVISTFAWVIFIWFRVFFWWLSNVTAGVLLRVFNFKRFPLSQEPASGKFTHSDSNEELYHQITFLMFMVSIFHSQECLLNHNWVVPNNLPVLFWFDSLAYNVLEVKMFWEGFQWLSIRTELQCFTWKGEGLYAGLLPGSTQLLVLCCTWIKQTQFCE